MPTISINKSHLFSLLEIDFSDEKFSEILFDFGLEVDDIVYEENGDITYKIEVGANRYDLLCLEGLVLALKCYIKDEAYIDIKEIKCNINNSCKETHNSILNKDFIFGENDRKRIESLNPSNYVVYQDNIEVRPFIACAIIHNIYFSENSYNRFIDYQDKLHSSLGRDRRIVAIGTHDLKNVAFPVFYKKMNPEEISFAPLNCMDKENAISIKDRYLKDTKMKAYSKILENYGEYPFFVDSNGMVLSLPPLINSNYSKISLNTTSIFVEVTGTDFNKVNMALKHILCNFRGKGYGKVRIEQQKCIQMEESQEKVIDILNRINLGDKNNYISPELKKSTGISLKNSEKLIFETPLLDDRTIKLNINYINKNLGLRLKKEEVVSLLKRMMYGATIESEEIFIKIPDSRSDVLHDCDILEDIAISYGFNNFEKRNVDFYTIATEDPLNKFCNKIRNEIAECGYNEVLTLCLLSKKDSINASEDKNNVKLLNPKSIECEVMRNNLLPGILKSINTNKHVSIPMKVFEISDIVKTNCDSIYNQKNLCACYAGKIDGLDNIVGLATKIFEKLGFDGRFYYKESETNDSIYFPLRRATIFIKNNKDGIYTDVGSLGVIKPQILEEFKIPFAVSSFEINLDKLFSLFSLFN